MSQYEMFDNGGPPKKIIPSKKNHSSLCVVLSISGGKDSTAMLSAVRERFPNVTTYCLYADTGFEHQNPVSAEEWIRQMVARFGMELVVVKNPKYTYLDLVNKRKKFPSAFTRFCTSETKRQPIEKFIRSLPYKTIINCMGIRAEESGSRSKMKPLTRNKNLTNSKRTVWNWFPIFRWKLEDVLEHHRERNLPLHPVYIWGSDKGYLQRFSCRVCIFQTDAEIRAIYKNDREAFDIISNMEKDLNFTMKNGKSLLQIVGEKTECGTHELVESMIKDDAAAFVCSGV